MGSKVILQGSNLLISFYIIVIFLFDALRYYAPTFIYFEILLSFLVAISFASKNLNYYVIFIPLLYLSLLFYKLLEFHSLDFGMIVGLVRLITFYLFIEIWKIKKYDCHRLFVSAFYTIIALGLLQLLLRLIVGVEIFPWARTHQNFVLPRVTSIFYEPAYFAQYLFFMTTYFIIYNEQTLKKYLNLVFVLLTQSFGGLVAMLITLVRSIEKRTFIVLCIFAAVIALVDNSIILDNRFYAAYVFLTSGSIEYCVPTTASIIRRFFTDFCTMFEYLREYPWTSILGLAFDDNATVRQTLNRVLEGDTVAANGVLEVFFRLGLIPFFIFALGIIRLKKKAIYFIIFVLLITQIDGAIIKPHLSLYVGLIFSLMLRGSRRDH